MGATCVAAQVNSSQVEQLNKMFQAVDTNKDGVLSVDELKETLQGAGVDDSTAAALIDCADIDCDGLVNYTEFLASLLATQGDLEDQMLDKAFSVFDADGNGCITAEEMSETITGDRRIDAVLPDGTTVADLVKEVDAPGDGAVSKSEFITYLREQRRHRPSSGQELLSDHSRQRCPPLQNDGAPDGLAKAEASDSLASVFARIGVELQKAPHPSDAHAPAPDYGTLCANHARRLAEV